MMSDWSSPVGVRVDTTGYHWIPLDTIRYLRVTTGYHQIPTGYLRVTIGYHRIPTGDHWIP